LWRVYQPFAELTRQGYVAEWCPLDDTPKVFNQIAMGVYEAVILPRLSWSDQAVARNWVSKLHAAGLTVIYEVDDDIFHPAIAERQRATTEPNKTLELLEQERRDRIAALRLCDGVTVSNERLARIVRQYVDTPVRVVPNSIDVRWFRGTLRGVRRVVPPLTIGWSGGARYPEDLVAVAAAWHTIAQRYPHVHFVVQGFPSELLYDAVPRDRLHVFQWRPVNEYILDLRNVDIGCASVSDNHFNACKTPIKLWEYTLAGAVSVVSPTLYGPVVSDGEDALVADTAAEWTSALSRLIDDAPLRRRLQRAQRRRVAEHHSLERNARQWPEAWSTIIREHQVKQFWQRFLAA
jgi:glycosyltransferase involved in cell wall biosynthesis